MKRKLSEKFFEQNQRVKTRKWKFFNLNQTLWGAGNREFRVTRFSQSGFLLTVIFPNIEIFRIFLALQGFMSTFT